MHQRLTDLPKTYPEGAAAKTYPEALAQPIWSHLKFLFSGFQVAPMSIGVGRLIYKLRLVLRKKPVDEEEAASSGLCAPSAPSLAKKSRGRTPGPQWPAFKQHHGRDFVAEARANKYKTITLECASGSVCPSGGTFQFSPAAQAFNEATFASRGTQKPLRCACALPALSRAQQACNYPSKHIAITCGYAGERWILAGHEMPIHMQP